MITLVVHGGAGTIHESDRDSYRAGLIAARDAGFQILQAKGGALEAVLRAVTLMEDNSQAFNAGTGSSPNREGMVECDAAVMLGSDGSSGAVAGIKVAQNPILIAEKVRTSTPHVLFVGSGADALVEHPVANASLLTERSREALTDWRRQGRGPKGSATVGAVALDDDGFLATATSTGGVLGKWPGRVGDSPLIGAGTYADRRIAISCTGQGEAFIRAVVAKGIAVALEHGTPLRQAIVDALSNIHDFGGLGGVICLTAAGEFGIGFNTPHMAFGWRNPQQVEAAVGLEPGVVVRSVRC